MPFRWRVSLFVTSALLTALLLQFSLGLVLFNRSLSRDLRSDLSHYANWLEQGLTKTPQGLSLSPEGQAALEQFAGYAGGRGRILDERGRLALEIGGPFPEDTGGWLMTRRPVLDAYLLEAAVSRSSHDREFRDYLQFNLLGLPLLAVTLGLGGFWLSWRLLRPLRNLQRAVTEMAISPNLDVRVSVGGAKDELSTLARSFNTMMARLERFLERERAFTRYASHELRNPMTALRVQVDAALAGDLPSERVLPTLKQELSRLSAMLDALLTLAQDQTPAKATLDLAVLAQEGVDRARLLASRYPRDEALFIDYSGPPSLGVWGDRALLGRLIDNLLENAVTHARTGQVSVTLSYTEAIRLTVSDQGPGVPEAAVAQLGTPFFRAKGVRAKGSGLGLSVVRHIAEAHGGEVTFENLEPGGFAVSVTLPQEGIA